MNLMVSQPLKVGRLSVQVVVGVRFRVDSPDAGPEGRVARLQWAFLLSRWRRS